MDYKRALITGASAGIGRSAALHLAEAGLDLVLVARREDRLAELKKEILAKYQVQVFTIIGDVRNGNDIKEKIDALGPEADKVDVLVNNAGLARGTERIQNAQIEHWDEMIDTNIKGLLALTRFMVPRFLKNKKGHVINIGSVAGRHVYPGGAVYCATKFAVRAISDGLRMDLQGTPIRVTNLEPGMVETEFSLVRTRDQAKADAVYQGMKPLTPDDLAECIVWSLTRPKHVNIHELVVYPVDQAGVGYVHRS
jgi:3-hydroxy acid dehydrogenase / malonic semialdehyde reductase